MVSVKASCRHVRFQGVALAQEHLAGCRTWVHECGCQTVGFW